MMLAVLAAAVLSLAQPPDNSCAPDGLLVQAVGSGPVERGAVTEFQIGVYNHGSAAVPTSVLSLWIDSERQVARLDRTTVAIAENDGPWQQIQRSTDSPDYSFIAPIAEFGLQPGESRTFRVRIHLDPTQPGSLKPGAALTLPGDTCTVRGGFDLLIHGPAPTTHQPSATSEWPPLLLGVGVGALGALTLFYVWPRRQPTRATRRTNE